MEFIMTSLIFFFLLLVKHAIADLALQARLTKGSKTNLWTSRLWIHCLDHAVLTFFIALLVVGMRDAIVLALLDFVLHFVIDHVKHRIQTTNNVTDQSRKYWNYATVDQIAHYTCYLIIVLIAV